MVADLVIVIVEAVVKHEVDVYIDAGYGTLMEHVNSDKNKLISDCIRYLDLHIIGITESHLINNKIIDIENYKWFGNNRNQINTRAKTGSGGVGLLVKNDVANVMNINIEDTTTDGIIWVKFTENTPSDNQFYVCVTYLPPEFSARSRLFMNFSIH